MSDGRLQSVRRCHLPYFSFFLHGGQPFEIKHTLERKASSFKACFPVS